MGTTTRAVGATAALGLLLLLGCATTRDVFVSTPVTGNVDDPVACEDTDCAYRMAEALGLRYQPIDDDGNEVGAATEVNQALMFAAGGVPMKVPLRASRIRVHARCQPELVVPGDRSRVEPTLVTPERRTAYLRSGATLRPFFFEAGSHVFPENAQVDVFRAWPDAAGGCTDAVVRVTNLGGVAATGLTYQETIDLTQRRYFLVDATRLSEEQTGGPSLADQVLAQQQAREMEQNQDVMGDGSAASREAESGQCTEARANLVEEILQNVHRRVDGDAWTREHREVFVATGRGVAIPYRPIEGGTHAVLAVSFEGLQVQVRRGGGPLTTGDARIASALEGVVTSSTSLQFRAEAGRDHEVRATGNGCSGILLYRQR